MKRAVFVLSFLFLWAVPAQALEQALIPVEPEAISEPAVEAVVPVVPYAVAAPVILDVVSPAVADVEAVPEAAAFAVEEVAPVAEAPVEEPKVEGAVPQPTEKVPDTPEEVGETLDKALFAAEGGHWTISVGFLLMLVIWILRRLGLLLKWGKGLPWLAMVVGSLGTFFAYLASGYTVGTAILYAFFSGGSAITLWEMVFKHIDSGKAKAKASA